MSLYKTDMGKKDLGKYGRGGTSESKIRRKWNQFCNLQLPLNLATPGPGSHCPFPLCYNFTFTSLSPWLNWKLFAIYFINCVCTVPNIGSSSRNRLEWTHKLPPCYLFWFCFSGKVMVLVRKVLGSWFVFNSLGSSLYSLEINPLSVTYNVFSPTLWVEFSLS